MPLTEDQNERTRVLASEITGRCESGGAAEIGIIIKRTIALAKMMDNKTIEYWAHILQSGIGIADEKSDEIACYSNDWEKALKLNETTKAFGGRAFSYYQRAGLGPGTMGYIFEEIAPLSISDMENELDDFRIQSYPSPDYPTEQLSRARAETNVMYIESVFERVINTTHDFAASVLSGLERMPAAHGISRTDFIPKRFRFFVYTNFSYWVWLIVKPCFNKFEDFVETRKGRNIVLLVSLVAALITIIMGVIHFKNSLANVVP